MVTDYSESGFVEKIAFGKLFAKPAKLMLSDGRHVLLRAFVLVLMSVLWRGRPSRYPQCPVQTS